MYVCVCACLSVCEGGLFATFARFGSSFSSAACCLAISWRTLPREETELARCSVQVATSGFATLNPKPSNPTP